MKSWVTVVCVTMIVLVAIAGGVKIYISHRSPYAPSRPEHIPANAIYIQGPNGHGLWEACSFQGADINCIIANVSGAVLHEGKFIPYRGAPPANSDELVITQKSGDGWVSLSNGTYLIPAEHNEASRRYLDFMVGNAKSFDK